MARAATPSNERLAQTVARRIQREVASRGWPVGDHLGGEAELLDRYGVSRGVFREAMRLCEHLQVAAMRRGPGGGLIVMQPDLHPVVDAAAVLLRAEGVTIHQLMRARRAVEGHAVELAGQRAGEEELLALRQRVEDEHQLRDVGPGDHMILHEQVAALTGNPVIEFFVQLLARLTALATLDGPGRTARAGRRDWVDAHAAIVEAIVAGNGGLARRRMDLHLVALGDALTARVGGEGRLPAALTIRDRALKRAEAIAGEIYREVAAAGWPVGTRLGSEAELGQRYGSGLGTIGEAARLLEHHGIASMRRGPGGGLFVARPGISAVTSAMAAWLEYRGATRAQLHEAGRALDLASVEEAARIADADTISGLREELARTARTEAEYVDDQGRNFHVLVAELSGNPVVAILMRVLVLVTIDLTPRRPAGTRRGQPGRSPAHRQHRAIVDAIEAKDPAVARRRMLRHLESIDRR